MKRSPWKRYCSLVAMAGVLQACTTLVSHSVTDGTTALPDSAFPYALPKTRLTTTFTVTLDSCDPPENPGEKGFAALKVSAITTQSFEADPTERYYIDYTKLSGFFKSTNLKVITNSDQTLQGLNSEYSDQSLQVAGAALQTAAGVAGAVLTGGASAAIPKVQQPKDASTTLFSRFLVDRKNIAPPPETVPAKEPDPPRGSACNRTTYRLYRAWIEKTQQLKLAQDSAKEVAAAVATSGVSAIATATSNQGGSVVDPGVTKATTALAKASEPLSITIPVVIEPQLSHFDSGTKGSAFSHDYLVDLVKRYVAPKWFALKKSDRPTYKIEDIRVTYKDGPVEDATVPITIELRVLPWSRGYDAKAAMTAAPASAASAPIYDGLQDDATNDRARNPAAFNGVEVRQPALGTVRVCIGSDDANKGRSCTPLDERGVIPADNDGTDRDLAAPVKVSIPQLGKKFALTLHNGFGDDVTLALALGADGSMNTLSFVNNSTAANGLTAVTNASTGYTAALTAENTAITARNGAVTAANTAQVSNAQFADTVLKAQSDCLQQQAAILKVGEVPAIGCK
ncbi:hypothetical protein [Caballeronia sp. 15711]|uniref:hypothetical protein n=1 Tax=Caballeronia sp. 15711 TaxID=3391029 RepID=UPI0039E6677A